MALTNIYGILTAGMAEGRGLKRRSSSVMNICTGYRGLKQHYPRLMVGMGNFDGVHVGHQALIRGLVDRCRMIGAVPGLFTFYPHPEAVLRPNQAPPMLLSATAKQELVARLGVEVLFSIPFTHEFAALAPEDFVRQVLVEELAVEGVFVGYNHTFGHRGKGNACLLQSLGRDFGFEVDVVPPVTIDGQVVSSTLIRRLLCAGEVREAGRYLGHEPFIDGPVVWGEQRGQKLLGFPTANIEVPRGVLVPADGVYAVRAHVDKDVFLGVANVGLRPTFKGKNSERNIEVHLFDFTGNLYDRHMRVLFRDRLRGEQAFTSPQELARQIELDIMRARRLHEA